jgi:hypothetical protein
MGCNGSYVRRIDWGIRDMEIACKGVKSGADPQVFEPQKNKNGENQYESSETNRSQHRQQ